MSLESWSSHIACEIARGKSVSYLVAVGLCICMLDRWHCSQFLLVVWGKGEKSIKCLRRPHAPQQESRAFSGLPKRSKIILNTKLYFGFKSWQIGPFPHRRKIPISCLVVFWGAVGIESLARLLLSPSLDGWRISDSAAATECERAIGVRVTALSSCQMAQHFARSV